MRKKQPYRLLICTNDEFNDAIDRLQFRHKTSSVAETIRSTILKAARKLPKVEVPNVR